jgi:hypothetical protein
MRNDSSGCAFPTMVAPVRRSDRAFRGGNENSPLSELQFLCAHTNKSFGTGVWTNNHALAMVKARGCTMHLDCPHCGTTHKVTINDALLMRGEDRADSSSVDSLPAASSESSQLGDGLGAPAHGVGNGPVGIRSIKETRLIACR